MTTKPKRICFECGRLTICQKAWMGYNRWRFVCWECLEDDDEGYAVCLS